jgi:glycosyl transferase family 20
MNLVAKEYVAAQDEQDPGVLVLSRFAGAAEDLEEALIVNPYDTDDVAEALQRAINMPQAERRARHKALLKRVRDRDARRWRESFLYALRRVSTSLFAKGPALPDGANPNFSAVAARPPTNVRLWHDADIPRARTLVDPLIPLRCGSRRSGILRSLAAGPSAFFFRRSDFGANAFVPRVQKVGKALISLGDDGVPRRSHRWLL